MPPPAFGRSGAAPAGSAPPRRRASGGTSGPGRSPREASSAVYTARRGGKGGTGSHRRYNAAPMSESSVKQARPPIEPARLKPGLSPADVERLAPRPASAALGRGAGTTAAAGAEAPGRVLHGRALVFWDPARPG